MWNNVLVMIHSVIAKGEFSVWRLCNLSQENRQTSDIKTLKIASKYSTTQPKKFNSNLQFNCKDSEKRDEGELRMKGKGIKLCTFTSVYKCSKHYIRKLTTIRGHPPAPLPSEAFCFCGNALQQNRGADVTLTSATCSEFDCSCNG